MPDPISWAISGPYYLAALLFGYLLGAIPFGLIVTKLFGMGDVRKIGSGSIGATNVLRTGRKDLAAATLILDAAKGGVAALLASHYGPDMAICAGFGAFLGHLFPVWLRFKGGKGIATALGVMLAIYWPVAAVSCGVWLLVAVLTRYSSVASLATTLCAPGVTWYLSRDWQLVQLAVAIAVLVWLKHYANMQRLLAGTETRIGQRKTK